MSKGEREWHVYCLSCSDSSLYCGVAADVARRVGEHNGGNDGAGKKGAKYTRSRRPVELVWSKKFRTRSEALCAEAAMKRLTRAEKLAIVRGGELPPAQRAKRAARAAKIAISKPKSQPKPKAKNKI